MFRQATIETHGALTIRRLGPGDADALARLAQRDSADVPEGTVYAAESAEGSLLAAISLESQALVADPFVPTADAANLLRAWARGLSEARRWRWTRGGLVVATSEAAATPAPTTTPC